MQCHSKNLGYPVLMIVAQGLNSCSDGIEWNTIFIRVKEKGFEKIKIVSILELEKLTPVE